MNARPSQRHTRESGYPDLFHGLRKHDAISSLFIQTPPLVAPDKIDLLFHPLPQPFAACNKLLPINFSISNLRQSCLNLPADFPSSIPRRVKGIGGIRLFDPIVETS